VNDDGVKAALGAMIAEAVRRVEIATIRMMVIDLYMVCLDFYLP